MRLKRRSLKDRGSSWTSFPPRRAPESCHAPCTAAGTSRASPGRPRVSAVGLRPATVLRSRRLEPLVLSGDIETASARDHHKKDKAAPRSCC